jgi:hypothetical protein
MKKILFTLALILSVSLANAQSDSTKFVLATFVKLPFSNKLNLVVDMGKGNGMKKISEEIPGTSETVKTFTEMLNLFVKLGYEYIGTFPGNIVNGPYGMQVSKDETVSLFRKR